MNAERTWQVLLLGGASGVGKTNVSYRLAQHYGVGLTEVDDFQVVLEGMTTPEQYPVLHYWQTHYDEARRMDEAAQLDFFLQYSGAMAQALVLVIANHLESLAPVVLEGDFILPSLAMHPVYGDVPADGKVQAVFLYEEDQQQIGSNYLLRDGYEQPDRARTSWLVSEWLRREAESLGVPTVSARPWETVLERTIAVVEG
ncbi:MAG: hypothetical protein M3Z66_15960 [Chloroflexota bacterium]|nr:hypothetical protein [Chloroflexota bacterium]